MRRWGPVVLLLAVAAYAVAASVWIGTDRRLPRKAFEAFSAQNTSAAGCSLAYHYLRERAAARGPGASPVTLLTRPLSVARVEPDAVLFRVGAASRDAWAHLACNPGTG